ncbi:MAG: DUF1552 domain-containing protein [Myxococcales bacterium]|nr:DUF1552 domain-containing protein [Myxococcales bacterium]
MKIDRSRRMFLQGLGGAVLALPLLESVIGKDAGAAAGTQACRLICIKSYSTQNITDWYPTFAGVGPVSGDSYTTRPSGGGNKQDGTTALVKQLAQNSGRHQDGSTYSGHEAPLADFAAGGVSRILDTSFNPFLAKMLLLRGCDFLPDTNHNDGGMLGNFAAADQDRGLRAVPTIDQLLAHSPKMYATTPAGVRSLHLSSGGANTFSFTDNGIQGGAVQQVSAHTNLQNAYQAVFGTMQSTPQPTVNPNLSLLDRVNEDYKALRAHRRLSADDRQTLDRHMTFMGELQNKLKAVGQGPSCQKPPSPGSVSVNGVDVSSLRTWFSAAIDLIVAAIVCDRTRIATLDIRKAIGAGVGAGGSDLGFVHSGLKDPTDWHETAHEWGTAQQDAKVFAINHWIATSVVLELLKRLDVAEPGGSKTYLDNSLVFWGNELGFNHLNWSVPVLLAGGVGGLKMGRYVDYIDWNKPGKFAQHNGTVIEGIPYNRVLVSLLQAFGLTPSEYESNGEAGYGATSTAGKTFNLHAIDYDMSQVGNPAPDLV